MFGNHGLCGLLEEGAHEKSPKCLGGNLGDFGRILQRSRPVFLMRIKKILNIASGEKCRFSAYLGKSDLSIG